MGTLVSQATKPSLTTPFPPKRRYKKDEKTGIMVPVNEIENIQWRSNLLGRAENDVVLQEDLLAACRESLPFFTNAFCWTLHQFEVDKETGKRYESPQPHVPFITWDIQDELFNKFNECLAKGEDVLVDKARDMGASWCCVIFMHWLWLFRKSKKLLEMSRTEGYVDLRGNDKALFQKHDYLNLWLPDWMRPPGCLPGQKHRTKMHMHNEITDSTIDGESTTAHAGSGDRRLVVLLDEFSKVENGTAMRSATRDVAIMRIINSTPSPIPGSEYSRWKKSGQIYVFVLPWWEHPQKGAGRYVKEKTDGGWEIRSTYYDYEETVRSPKELAVELNREDVEAGETFFTGVNIDKHVALYGSEPKRQLSINLKKGISEDAIRAMIKRKDASSVVVKRSGNGPLKVWCELFGGRPDQSRAYIFGIDIGKGQGASHSVVSIKCKETNEKIAEWADANTPPYEMVPIVIALALWCGGRKPHGLPFLKWEMNGPGWDFGRLMVKTYHYPYFYKHFREGTTDNTKSKKYGWHSSRESKKLLLDCYERHLAHGGYVNHSVPALLECKDYIYYPDGSIGPATLFEESPAAKKLHGDRVIADALTLDDNEIPQGKPEEMPAPPPGSAGWRMKRTLARKRKPKGWRKPFKF